MKLACIIFQSGDYTKTAIEAETYRTTLRAMGHTFDILFSTKDSGVSGAVLPKPDRVHGRYESSVIVDGMVSHHPNRCRSAATWIAFNYDAVLFIGLCPYPTKSYGSSPDWVKLYQAIEVPKIGKVIDVMPETEWTDLAYRGLDLVWFSQGCFMPANSPGFDKLRGQGTKILPTPFHCSTELVNIEKTKKRSVIWAGEWNRVNGIVEFIEEIPKIGEHSTVTLTGLGSQYFRQRKKDHWHQAVRHDFYADFDGIGPADSIGRGSYTGLTPKMVESWAAVDLIGLLSGDLHHHSYVEGMYTPCMIEALYKGTWPIVAAECAGSPIPIEFLRHVVDQEDISDSVETINEPLAGTQLGDRAKEWVRDTHDSYANSATLIQDIGGMI